MREFLPLIDMTAVLCARRRRSLPFLISVARKIVKYGRVLHYRIMLNNNTGTKRLIAAIKAADQAPA